MDRPCKVPVSSDERTGARKDLAIMGVVATAFAAVGTIMVSFGTHQASVATGYLQVMGIAGVIVAAAIGVYWILEGPRSAAHLAIGLAASGALAAAAIVVCRWMLTVPVPFRMHTALPDTLLTLLLVGLVAACLAMAAGIACRGLVRTACRAFVAPVVPEGQDAG